VCDQGQEAERRGASRRRPHLVALGLVGALVSTLVSSCGFGGSVDGGMYPYWVLNDSGSRVVVDVREALHKTFVVPPHTYGALVEGLAPLDPKWTISVVDDQCLALQTWTVDATHNLAYMAPNGDRELTDDLAWSHGLRTATSADLVERVPRCP
jgi:hypothetical protein